MLTLMVLAAASVTPEAALAPLAFLAGHCWRAEFKPGVEDTHCFERAYGGKHLRDRHQVTGGYGGETIYSWDPKAGAVAYTYWNSLGGVSRGSMKPNGDKLDFGDESYTAPNGKTSKIATWWKRLGDDAYEAVTHSANMPSMNRTVTYRRVAQQVSIETSKLPDGTHMLTHETIVAAPVEQVWAAITTPEGWRGWAVPVARMVDADTLETSYDPAAGPATTIRQRLDARIPYRLLAFRTIKAPQGFPNFETYARVQSMIALEPAGEGRTRVRLTGVGYADDEAGRQLLSFFREGNRVSLERLQRRFVSGPLDWAKEK